MNVSQQININAPTSQLWQILAEEFDQVSEWAAVVLESGPNPQVPVGEGRVCLTTIGKNTEVITHRDEKELTYTYAVVPEKSPFFFNSLENTVVIKSMGNDQSEVSFSANVQLSPLIGQLVGPLMKRRMLKGFTGILEELKHYAETGEVHARKQKHLRPLSKEI